MNLLCAKKETLPHLFLESELAKEVWQHFSLKLHKPFHYATVEQLLRGWLTGSSRRAQLGYVTLTIIFYGLWEIWKEQCSMKYEDIKRPWSQIIHAIYEHIYTRNLLHTPKRKPTHWEINILEKLRLPVRTIETKKGRWIAWSKPEPGWIKVNTDGSKHGKITTGGGVFRDESGRFIFCFCTKFPHQDSLRAELEAILEGALACKQMGITHYILQTDSSLAYTMLHNPDTEQWQYNYILRRIRDSLEHTSMTSSS